MRRAVLGLVLALTALSFAVTASAQNPHFIKSQTGFTVDPATGALVANFKASGFGAGEAVTLTLEAETSSLTLGCVNRGGNEPQGLQTFVGPVEASDVFQASRTGTVRGSISALPQGAEDFECPSRNMQEVVVFAQYCNIVLTAESVTGTATFTEPGCVTFQRQ